MTSPRRTTITIRAAAALAAAAALLAACGQKGPLYIPDEPGEVVTRPTTPDQPRDSEESDSEEKERDEDAKPQR